MYSGLNAVSGGPVLVLGGAGFVGSHLVDELLNSGCPVVVVDNLVTGSLDNLPLANSNLVFHRMDLANIDESRSPKDRFDALVGTASFVFNLASPLGVHKVHRHRLDTTSAILKSGMTVVEACLRHGTPLLFTSTSEVYALLGSTGEATAGGDGNGAKPRWCYSAAKLSIEHLVAGLYVEHDIPAWNVRLFNVVGARQSLQSGHVIPAMCNAVLKCEPIKVFGDGTDRRTFLHVKDAVRALLEIPKHIRLCERPTDLGSDEKLSINDVARRISELSEAAADIRHVPFETVFGENFARIADRTPNTEPLNAVTGWRPTLTFDEAIRDCYQLLARQRCQTAS
jgi:UDP-glucose 4-epimerase